MFKTSKNYKIYPVEFINKVKETDETYTYHFTKPKDLEWEEGAHTHLALNHFDQSIGWWQKKDIHHFSIMSLPEENVISFTTRFRVLHSDYKEELDQLKKGDPLYVFKVGSRVKLKRVERPISLISGGVALATFRPLVYRYAKDDSHIGDMYVLNIDSSGNFLYADEMMQYEQNADKLSVQYVERRELFYAYLQDRIDSLGIDKGYYYIVGSDEFIASVYQELQKYAIDNEQIILDKKPEFYQKLFNID